MLVIGGIAGRDLARPVERQPHGFELRLHCGDVLIRPRLRVDLALHGRVLGRHAEGVPPHGMQHVQPHGAFEARDHVAHRVVAHVSHVDAPGRIREHLEHVVFPARIVVAGGKDAPLVPHLLPAGLRLASVVAFDGHGMSMPAKSLPGTRAAGRPWSTISGRRNLHLCRELAQVGNNAQIPSAARSNIGCHRPLLLGSVSRKSGGPPISDLGARSGVLARLRSIDCQARRT